MVILYFTKINPLGLNLCLTSNNYFSSFISNNIKISFVDFCVTSNSKVIVICAGVRPIKGESRLNLVQRNTEILKNIIPLLVNYSPNAVFVVISNPG